MDSNAISDNQLLSYQVNPEGSRIVFHTVYLHKIPHRYNDLIFNGVIAYEIQGNTDNSEIFDVDEVPIDELLTEEKTTFQAALGQDEAGYANVLCSLAGRLRGDHIHAYKILSMQFHAWVLARDMHVSAFEELDG